MESQPLTREAVIRRLGDVDDSTIAGVIATGASSAELTLAIVRLRNDRVIWRRRDPGEPRIAALCKVLEAWWNRDDEPEYVGTD
jgi:hypothetical protein